MAKLAQKGKGRTVRFQGGSLFPISVVVVVIVGLALIVYGRVSQPEADASPPTVEDHWHEAFGIYACGEWLPNLQGTAESPAEGGDYDAYLKYYVHSHGDGVMHWHSFSGRASGKRARLKVFLDVYDIKLSDDKLELPDSQVGGGDDGSQRVFEEGETKCDGEDAHLSVVYWPSYTSTANSRSSIANMGDARIENDGGVFVIAFMPDGADIPQPPHTANLVELGAADSGQAPIPSSTVVDGSSTTVVDGSSTSVADTNPSSTVEGETTTTAAEGSTTSAPAADTPTTTSIPSSTTPG